jgi:hypothetical protein
MALSEIGVLSGKEKGRRLTIGRPALVGAYLGLAAMRNIFGLVRVGFASK